MLRRHRQIKMQIQQMLDACLFGLSFWFAWLLRSDPFIMEVFGLKIVPSFDSYVWLYLVLVVTGPLVLEAQGFYDRPLIAPRRGVLWPLFKSCLVTTVGLIIIIYFFNLTLARAVAVLFGIISFLLILTKE